MSVKPSSAARPLVAAGTGVDAGSKLLHQPEVVAVVPDLRHLAVVAEAEDVDPGELGRFPVGASPAPPTRVRAGSGPSSRNEIAIGKHEIDSPPKVGECAPELLRDPRLPGCSGSSLRRTKIVTHVVIGEDHCGEPYVSTRPHFLVEAHDELLVRVGVTIRSGILVTRHGITRLFVA